MKDTTSVNDSLADVEQHIDLLFRLKTKIKFIHKYTHNKVLSSGMAVKNFRKNGKDIDIYLAVCINASKEVEFIYFINDGKKVYGTKSIKNFESHVDFIWRRL